jgi:acyl-CoA dehydrogenase
MRITWWGMNDNIMRQIDVWLQRCPDPANDPLSGMAEAELLKPLSDYGSVARVKAALVEHTGLLGIASIWGGRQLVSRFFIDGFGNDVQRVAWRGRALSVAISEPKVGAHPKHLATRAEPAGGGFRITGEKAWVSNAPLAEAIIVLAITSVDGARKRYTAFIVPRDTPGTTMTNMPAFHALRPSRHCGLRLDGAWVPDAAILGETGSAYELMALPFRDVEDVVGMFGLLGAFRFLLDWIGVESDAAALSAGGLIGLVSVFDDAANAVVAALDAGCLSRKSATLVGLRSLAAAWVMRVRAHQTEFGPNDNAVVEQMLADVDATLSVARRPRMARQRNLAREAREVDGRQRRK